MCQGLDWIEDCLEVLMIRCWRFPPYLSRVMPAKAYGLSPGPEIVQDLARGPYSLHMYVGKHSRHRDVKKAWFALFEHAFYFSFILGLPPGTLSRTLIKLVQAMCRHQVS